MLEITKINGCMYSFLCDVAGWDNNNNYQIFFYLQQMKILNRTVQGNMRQIRVKKMDFHGLRNIETPWKTFYAAMTSTLYSLKLINIYAFNEYFNLTYFTPFSGVSIVDFQQQLDYVFKIKCGKRFTENLYFFNRRLRSVYPEDFYH